jgi:hypothetical protein
MPYRQNHFRQDEMNDEKADMASRSAMIGLWILGSVSLQDLAVWASIFAGVAGGVYALVSAAKLLWNWFHEWKAKR